MANNIIFYFTDQQRWDTCGCYGQPLDITPNLDALAAEGVKFENAFSPQPVCGPCRALFQTGKYPTETGCFRNNIMLPKGIKTLGEYMEQDAGYETAYIGKWHLASDGELEQHDIVAEAAGFGGISAGLEQSAAGTADRLGRECILEPDTFRSQGVQVGRNVQGLTIAATGIPALLIGEIEDNIVSH